jgi:hypothetical protein
MNELSIVKEEAFFHAPERYSAKKSDDTENKTAGTNERYHDRD